MLIPLVMGYIKVIKGKGRALDPTKLLGCPLGEGQCQRLRELQQREKIIPFPKKGLMGRVSLWLKKKCNSNNNLTQIRKRVLFVVVYY